MGLSDTDGEEDDDRHVYAQLAGELLQRETRLKCCMDWIITRFPTTFAWPLPYPSPASIEHTATDRT